MAEAQRLRQTGSFGWNVSSGEIFWSEETYRIFQSDRTTKPTAEFVLSRVHPEDRDLVQQQIDRASRDGQSFDFEHRLSFPGGSIKHVRVTARPSQDCSGSLEFVGAVKDITERKHAEEGLQQIVDFVRHIITVVSPNGKIIYANRVAREYTGLTLDEYRSVDVIARIIHPDDAARMRAVRKRGLSANNPFEIEARTLGKGGACRWFREEIDKASTFEEIVGASPVLKAVLSHVSKVARCDSTVLITGETGTCRELLHAPSTDDQTAPRVHS